MTRIALAAACIAASNAAAAADEWALRLPKDEKVVFRGVVSMDGAGLPGAAIMYPAPNVVGLLAAIATHGVIAEAARTEQKNKLQAEADKVLAPYLPILDGYTYRALMQRGLERSRLPGNKRLIEAEAPAGGATVIEAAPVLFLT